jgi:glycosyltransferase involved in cell wall biosynthesis
VAFLGSYAHPPNRDAVDHFLERVWPQVHQQHPNLRFHIYGSGLTRDLAAAWQATPGVEVEGWIADVSHLYGKHRVLVAPLRSGAGIKGKVMAAAAHGLPQVLSPLAAESTGLRHGQEAFVARTPEQWVEAMDHLCGNPLDWEHMSAAAHSFAREHFSRAKGLALMREALQRLELPTR